ncbi:hypothetical protein [Paenirhodobacter sp. CAU 1674]|uniref:hypothetical protein n=1 Tax=Paenirhodobacter sp. CAU 1674 TaxID=3032596 RepID=UPI0023DA6F48|nr:hypothetical protein [Paenirhodobacter sp. CAU 1674]MDF2141228.1 hypothetical protein [Paenirhodobacter sp. CAU 1674]
MDKRIPNAEIRRVWLDQSMTSAEAAEMVGLSRLHLWRRAKLLDLPSRKDGRRPVIPEAELRVLWLADVLASDIAKLYRCPRRSVRQSCRRIGLAARSTDAHHTITLQQFRASLIKRANTPGEQLSDVERTLLEKTRPQ